MDEAKISIGRLFESLQERTKELNCLYAIEEILRAPGKTPEDICRAIVCALPPGMQYPEACRIKIDLYGHTYCSPGFSQSPRILTADINVRDKRIGAIEIHYTTDGPAGSSLFLKEEHQLVKTVANRLGHYMTCHQLRCLVEGVQSAREELTKVTEHRWRVVLELLRRTDQDLFHRIAQKMLNQLCWHGIGPAQQLVRADTGQLCDGETVSDDPNRPRRRASWSLSPDTINAIFNIAAEFVPDEDILACIRKWIQEDKMGFLVQVVNRHLTLPVVADAIRRYQRSGLPPSSALSPARRGVEIALIRRFFSDQLDFICRARDYFRISDFAGLLPRLIYTSDSYGKLGEKSAGLYLAAQVLAKAGQDGLPVADITIPRTWHITSDILLYFMHHNNLDDVVEQKYKGINQVRQEYPRIVQIFKRGRFPSDILKGLSMALDNFGNRPIIVRSSSLLDEHGAAELAGKYITRILANQGTKQQRLQALTDAIAEIYASTFGPEPISYRAERGLIDLGEEMGIIIQEVVGTRIGHYFLPAFTGIACSCNRVRWSKLLEPEDGLLSLVPGLGTRLMNCHSGGYSILVAPGKPEVRITDDVQELKRYAPKQIDVINMMANRVETVSVADFFRQYLLEYPGIRKIVSAVNGGHRLLDHEGLRDFNRDDLFVTFDGLIADSSLMSRLHSSLSLLNDQLGMPIEFEFASDGQRLYLLKCQRNDSENVADGLTSLYNSFPASETRQKDRQNRCVMIIHQLAAKLDSERFGECEMYVTRNDEMQKSISTKPIRVFICCRGTGEQRKLLQLWIEGWIVCLGKMHSLVGGQQDNNPLQIHLLNVNHPSDKTTHQNLKNAVAHGSFFIPCGQNR